MIGPVLCFTCGKVIGNKYRWYLAQVREKKINKKQNTDKVLYLTDDFVDKTPEGEVMDELGLNKMCCRRHMLTHVDIE